MTVTYDEILADLKNKSFYKIVANIKELTVIEQFRLNEAWTDYLQHRIDFGNKYLLKGIQYRLIMEDV
jgi:hypothetical protein